MKRTKPCQHRRKLRSGKVITVNKGVKKRRRSNYGSVPRMQKTSLANKPIKDLTDREFMILVDQGQFGSSPFSSMINKRTRSRKKSYGFEPWDRGDESFYRKLKNNLGKDQERRIRAASNPPRVQDQLYQDDLRELDKEIDRKFGVLTGMAKRRDGSLDLQSKQAAEDSFKNRRLISGTQSTPMGTSSAKRQEERDSRSSKQRKDWRELSNVKIKLKK